MEITKETRERIFAAADQLYEQAGRESFPTVDAVRKQARVNMNDASVGMKEWRRAQTAQAAPIAVRVPEAVQQAGDQAVATMWQHAQELANESLRAAQAGWDAERTLIESVSEQTSQAFDEQAQELEGTRLALKGVQGELEQSVALNQELAQQIAGLKESLAGMTSTADQYKARAEEIDRRANDLRAELDHAHRVGKEAQLELERLRDNLDQRNTLIEALRSELATVKAHSEAIVTAHQEYRQETMRAAERAAQQIEQVQGERDSARSELEKLRTSQAILEERAEAAAKAGDSMREAQARTLGELEQQRSAASQAREEAARLQGQIEALEAKAKPGAKR